MNKTRTEYPLLLLGCLHAGFRFANLAYTEGAIDWARRCRAGILVLGDNFENALPNKPHMMWDQLTEPEAQLDYVEALLRPVAGQIVGAVTSNHSRRSRKAAGIDLDRQLACRLGYRNKYHGTIGHTVLPVGKMKYRIIYTHGIGSGSNVLSDFRAINTMYPNADLICASHTHTCLTTSEGFFTMTDGGRHTHRVVYARTGSGITYPSYAEEQLYRPQPMGYSVVWLGLQSKSIRVETYVNFSKVKHG